MFSKLLLLLFYAALSSSAIIKDAGQRSPCMKRSEWLYGQPVRVYLTISPKLTPLPRLLQINWEFFPNETASPNDSVSLMFGRYMSNTSVTLQTDKVRPGVHGRGSLVTGHVYGGANLEQERDTPDQCSLFWVVYRRGPSILASNCIRKHKDWMWQNREYLKDKSLLSLMIPGTHDSGAYDTADNKGLGFFGDKLVVTQDESVWNQLMYGIRYLDLRVGFREKRPRNPFWIYHGIVAVRPIDDVLADIKRFMAQSRDIVIIDFHKLSAGFNQTIHDKFVNVLISNISPWILPRSDRLPTLGQMWDSNQRLVIGYASSDTVQRHNTLWNNVEHAWGNVQSKPNLFRYLNSVMLDPPQGHLWSAMAELTPTVWYLIGAQPGLRQLAQSVNNDVTAWSQRHWWHLANIVATDFFMANDIIAVSIDANLKRYQSQPDSRKNIFQLKNIVNRC